MKLKNAKEPRQLWDPGLDLSLSGHTLSLSPKVSLPLSVHTLPPTHPKMNSFFQVPSAFSLRASVTSLASPWHRTITNLLVHAVLLCFYSQE